MFPLDFEQGLLGEHKTKGTSIQCIGTLLRLPVILMCCPRIRLQSSETPEDRSKMVLTFFRAAINLWNSVFAAIKHR